MPEPFDATSIFRPRVFIGSSSEARDLAVLLEDDLREHDIDATVWSEDVFQLGEHTLTALTKFLGNYDFGVMIFWPDDDLTMRGKSYKATRDNVVLELGMFIGALGPGRAFILRNKKTDRWLSDLAGLVVADFEAGSNLKSAAGRAIMQIRQAIQAQTPRCITSHHFMTIEDAHAYMSLLLQKGGINTVRQVSLSTQPYQNLKEVERFKTDIANFIAKDGTAYWYVYSPTVPGRRSRVEHLLKGTRTNNIHVRELPGKFEWDARNFILFNESEVVVAVPTSRGLPHKMSLHRRPEVIGSYDAQFSALFTSGNLPAYCQHHDG